MAQVPIYFKVDLQVICSVLIDNADRLTKRQSNALIRALSAPRQEEPPEENQIERYCKLHSLSCRQGEILELLIQGLSTSEIARKLTLTTRTVDSHLATMFGKTSCCNRTQLVASVLTSKL